MRVLVTGAGGFSGVNIVGALLAAGHEVVAVVGRNSESRLPRDFGTPPNLTLLFGDLAGGLVLPGAVEGVVHTAAVAPGPGVRATAADFIRNNAEATRRLVLWARGIGVKKFIYFSSLSVFGRISGPVVDESTPRVATDAYGASKWLGEVVLYEQGDAMASLSLRLPGIVGPGAVRNWLATMAVAAQEGREIAYFHGDAGYNNAVHIDDLCRLVTGLLCRDLMGHDMVTLGAAGAMKVRDMVTAMAVGLGGRSSLREIPAPRPSFTVSSARARKMYDYQPLAMRDMIARFVTEIKG